MKRCPVCLREFPDRSKFCNHDGATLVSQAPAVSAKLMLNQFDGVKREFSLSGDSPTTVGKSPDNNIVLTDPAISRRHASFEVRDGRFYVRDLGSLNGILVNGRKIGNDEVELSDGDEIAIGRSVIIFKLSTRVRADKEVPATPVAATPRQAAPPLSPPPQIKVADTGELRSVSEPAQQRDYSTQQARMLLDGRYEIIDKLSQDATGTLYRARRIMLGDEVAIRVLRPELVGNDVALERFRRQAMVAARIKHPNSVQVFDFGHTPQGPAYIVEELLGGRTLRDLIRKEGSFSLPHVVNIFNQVCGAVHAAHLNGIILRDIKPESIFVETDAEGRELIKVGGYGLAKVDDSISHGKSITGPMGVVGTPAYMSPEQWLHKPLDGRADIYALGVILFELLTGSLPFTARDPQELMNQHLYESPPDMTERGRGELDEDVAAVVNRALSKSPEMRQPTALLLAEELQAVSGAREGLIGRLVAKATGILPYAPVIVGQRVEAAPGETALPAVLPEVKEKGRGAFNPVVTALMAEAFLSRISSGLIKTSVPLYALLVFGMKITTVMGLVLIQNIVPLVLRPVFGSMADKYGKKRIFMVSLTIRTLVSLMYAFATLPPMLFVISMIRGVADSAKGPSASAMIADNTDERSVAQAYSWYTTTKSTSGGIGEALAAFILIILLGWFMGVQTVTANVAVMDKFKRGGQNVEEIVKDPASARQGYPLPGTEKDPKAARVMRVEQRQMKLGDVPIEDLPKVVDSGPLRKTLVAIFILSTVFSACSLLLVAIFIKEKQKEKKEKKDKQKDKQAGTAENPGETAPPAEQPNVWAFALLGMALTAPAYMVTGEFFVILAVKLEVTSGALGWIKILAETVTPLLFGPFFGWLADRIGAGKVIALRSVANLLTSALFWIVPWFAGTALLGLIMGIARAVDEIGKAAFKPTWGAISARVSSYNLAKRSKTMGILEAGVDTSDLAFPVIAGAMLQYLSLGPLMLVRAILALIAEVYGHLLMKKYKI